MSQMVRDRAAQIRAEVAAVVALELPEPSPADSALALDMVSDDFAAQIQARLAAPDLQEDLALARFGQTEWLSLHQLIREMQGRLAARHPEALGDVLASGAEALEALIAPSPRLRLWDRLRGRSGGDASEIAALKARLCGDLLAQQDALLHHIRALDGLYETGLDRYDALTLAIAAGQEGLRRRGADDPTLPALRHRLEALQQCRRAAMTAMPPLRQLQEAKKALLLSLSELMAALLSEAPRPLGPSALQPALEAARALSRAGQDHHRQARAALDRLLDVFAP